MRIVQKTDANNFVNGGCLFTPFSRTPQFAYLVQWSFVLAYGLLSLMPSAVLAENIDRMFQSTQIVENYSAKARRQAARKGLKEILVRYSGSENILHEAGVVSLLQNPESLLSSFKYLSLVNDSAKLPENTSATANQPMNKAGAQSPNTKVVNTGAANTGAVNPKSPDGQIMGHGIVLEFDGQLVGEHFVRKKLPIWSVNRPRLVIWWALDDQKQRQLVQEKQPGASGLGGALNTSARIRGLPLVLPLMDKQDQHALEVNDVWLLDYDRLEVVSRRYKPGAILVARSSYTLSKKWFGQWGLISDGRLTTGRVEAADETHLARKVIDEVSEILAKEYSVVVQEGVGNDDLIQLVIHNINDLSGYAQVSDYLEKLMLVKYLGLVRVEPSKLIFDLELHGGLDQFRREIRLDHRLSAISSVSSRPALAVAGIDPGQNQQATQQIEYRWIRPE